MATNEDLEQALHDLNDLLNEIVIDSETRVILQRLEADIRNLVGVNCPAGQNQ